jgi:hypothetical protein
VLLVLIIGVAADAESGNTCRKPTDLENSESEWPDRNPRGEESDPHQFLLVIIDVIPFLLLFVGSFNTLIWLLVTVIRSLYVLTTVAAWDG